MTLSESGISPTIRTAVNAAQQRRSTITTTGEPCSVVTSATCSSASYDPLASRHVITAVSFGTGRSHAKTATKIVPSPIIAEAMMGPGPS